MQSLLIVIRLGMLHALQSRFPFYIPDVTYNSRACYFALHRRKASRASYIPACILLQLFTHILVCYGIILNANILICFSPITLFDWSLTWMYELFIYCCEKKNAFIDMHVTNSPYFLGLEILLSCLKSCSSIPRPCVFYRVTLSGALSWTACPFLL